MNPKNQAKYSFKKAYAAWLAGFWEGEGWISVNRFLRKRPKRRDNFYWNVSIGVCQSKDHGAKCLHELNHLLGFGRVEYKPAGVYGMRGVVDEAWKYVITDREQLKEFVSIIYPFLRFRREEVDQKLALISRIEEDPHVES